MSLDIYFARNIEQALSAVLYSSIATPGGNSDYRAGYQEGVQNTVISIALAFGIKPLRDTDADGNTRLRLEAG